MNKYILSLSSGSIGVIAGLLLTASLKGNVGDVLIGISVGAVPTGWLAHVITESRYQSKLNESESKLSTCSSKAQSVELSLKELQCKFDVLSANYRTLFEQYQALKGEKAKDKLELKKFDTVVIELSKAKSQIQELLEVKEQYEVDWQSMQENQEQLISNEVKKRLRESQRKEIQRIWDEADKHCQNFMKDMDVATELMLAFKDRADGSKSIALSLGESACKFREEKNKQIDSLVEELEIKNARIAILQQKLEGDLIQPEYINCGFDQNGRIVNAIAEYLWNHHQIPLKVTGYEVGSEGIVTAGYVYSRSMSPEALVKVIEGESSQMPKILGLYAVEKPQKLQIADVFTLNVRRDRPKPLTDDAVYRILKPASVSLKILREATDHRKGGKPTLRIMGATGEGKGIIARALLADWVKHESGEVWLSDPVDGSDEDRWEVPKVAKSSREARELLKTFKAEFESRKDKISPRKAIQVLALFDEFDKEHPKEDKELIKDIWTAIRHHKMRLILMGQSSEVGSNGWKWDEMNNCACLFVGSGISTAIKHAKDLGISRITANQLEIQKNQINNWLESKNQGLDAASQYRVALLVVGEKVQFLELPMAYEGVIKNASSSIVSYPWQSLEGEVKPSVADSKICPGCGGKLRKSGQRLRCESASHTKDMGVKSFPLNG